MITLGIIGIVAAVTLQILIANYQEKVTVLKLNQTYNLLLNATKSMLYDEGITIDKFESRNNYFELLPKYLKFIDTCDAYSTDGADCLIKYLRIKSRFNNDEGTYIQSYSMRAVLPNGVVMAFKAGGACQQDMSLRKKGCPGTDLSCLNSEPTVIYGTYLHECGAILIDINGAKGPNTANKDVFLFWLVQDGIVPAGSSNEVIWTQTFDAQCLGKNVYSDKGYCSAWIIYNKNMDYLHCPDKLGWEKSSSCK